MIEAVGEIIDDLPGNDVYVQGCSYDKLPKNFESFHDIMSEMSADNIDKEIRKDVKALEGASCVFTSGTTGK